MHIVDDMVKMVSNNSHNAQTTCKASLNSVKLYTFLTNGTYGNWIYQKLLVIRMEKGWYNLNLKFPESGIQVEYIEFIMEE